MSDLAMASVTLGAVLAVPYLLLVLMPVRTREWLAGLPRNKWAGRLLALVGMIWTEYLFLTIPLGQFEKARPGLCVMAPIALILMCRYMEDLLAARALGGLLLLVPAPLLAIARWHESPWRLVIVVISYIMVVKGIALVLGPHLFRRWVEFWFRSDTTCRIWGAAGLVLAGFVIVLGLAVF